MADTIPSEDRFPRYDAEMRLRSAHAVRQLGLCDLCRGVLSKQHCVRRDKKLFHGRCFIAQWGLPELLKQDGAVIGSLMLADIGDDAMRAILDSRSTQHAE